MDSGPLDPDPNAIPKVKAPRKQNQNQKTEQNRKKENTDSGNNGTHRKEKTIGTWNIRRGLIKRENEIVEILTSQNIDVLFLTETDTKRSDAEKFVIKGFNTVMQRVSEEEDIVRVIALIRENTGLEIKTRSDLMSDSFPSVWLEIKEENKSSTLLGGFYRQWTCNGIG